MGNNCNFIKKFKINLDQLLGSLLLPFSTPENSKLDPDPQ